MSKLQKIAQCNSNGKLWLASDVFEDVSWEFLADIESMSDKREKLRMYLKYADYCLQFQMDKEAFHYYRLILGETIIQNMILLDFKEIAEKAYNGLVNLMHGNDEYIWESGLTVIDCYGDLFEDTNDV